MGAIAFELSGPFIACDSGGPTPRDVSGGLAACRSRARSAWRQAGPGIAVLAVVFGLIIYAGDPEVVLLLGGSAAIFAVGMLLLRWRPLGGSGPVVRPLVDRPWASLPFGSCRSTRPAGAPRRPRDPTAMLWDRPWALRACPPRSCSI